MYFRHSAPRSMELLYLLSEASLGSGPSRSAQNIGPRPGTYDASPTIEMATIKTVALRSLQASAEGSAYGHRG